MIKRAISILLVVMLFNNMAMAQNKILFEKKLDGVTVQLRHKKTAPICDEEAGR